MRRAALLVAGTVWLIVFVLVWLVEKQPVWVSALVGVWGGFCLYMFWLGTIRRER